MFTARTHTHCTRKYLMLKNVLLNKAFVRLAHS